MPGLVGFVGGQQHSETLLHQMADALLDEMWYEASLNQGESFGLGRISISKLNANLQPIWNEAKTVCLALEGELFDTDSLRRRLLSFGHIFRSGDAAEFALRLYEECGEDFATELNGAFTIAIWDGRSQKLIIANDRLGLHPLYYACYADRLIFASGVRALLADPHLSRQVDLVGIAQFLTFDHMLHDRTLLANVKILRPASLLTFHKGQLKIRSYWTMRYTEYLKPVSEEVYLEKLLHHLQQAVFRQAAGKQPAAILLSGGLDSRILLGFLSQGDLNERLSAFTFGVPGCYDSRFAQEIAARSGVKHRFFELQPDYLIRYAEKGIRLTDGMQNCVHMHTLANLTDEAKEAQVFYKGFMGDAMMGYAITRQLWGNYDDNSRLHFQTHRAQGLILFDMSEQEKLFTRQFQTLVTTQVMDEYKAAMMESGSDLVADQRNYFDLRQRVPRMTLHGVELVRSRGIVRMPFCDNDLVDFSLSLNPGLRFDRYLIKKALIRAFPELAKVPYTGTGYPLMPCLRETGMRLNSQIRWRLRDAGLRWIPPVEQPRPYADYHGWFRTTLRSWVEGILLDKRTLERGYFDPGYVKNLLTDHMAGINHAPRLGALMSLELWHRQFLD